jgi:RimJ/RimL family protein N-acetyltransferase
VLFVSSKYRGLGLATGLLLFAVEEMSKGGVSLVEAHVDSGNLASVRAFLKAGFHAFRTTGGDFYVSYQVPDLQPKGP